MEPLSYLQILKRHVINKLSIEKEKKSNNCFNLINPLAWFLREDHAKTTPSLRSSSGADLKVKPMLA